MKNIVFCHFSFVRPADVDAVHIDPLVHRSGSEDPPGPGAQVPGEQDVALDEGDGEVVGAGSLRPRLAKEHQQCHLVDIAR